MVGSIAESTNINMTAEKKCIHSMLCRLSRQKGRELPLVQGSGVSINVCLKQGVDKYFLIDNFEHNQHEPLAPSFRKP